VAVVQISKIQIRRGQKNQGSGLPQLASGELGWAIDTQELYIGNGAVAEGAPQVGNTKVITEHDDLFTLADRYTYRSQDGSITTGIDSSNPVIRKLQDRLDDRVSIRAFGVTGNESQDATIPLQRAIDQIYLNAGSEPIVKNRVVLHLEAGIYTITDTIYLPPYATLVGAGDGKTIIRQTANNKAAFQTVNHTSTPGVPASESTSEYANQARDINLSGMTIEVLGSSKGLVLQSCRDSHFSNIRIKGTWELGDLVDSDSSTTSNVGLLLNSKNGAVETIRNEFNDVYIENFAYGVISNWDINDNSFFACQFNNLSYGVSFGKDIIISGNIPNGTAFGPRSNTISTSVFTNIERNAIYVKEGQYNISSNNKFSSCGNDGGSEEQPVYSVLRFDKLGNESVNDYFSRTAVLSYTQSAINTVPYIPEVQGPVAYEWGFEHEVTVLNGDNLNLFRLPQALSQGFIVKYVMISEVNNAMRVGELHMMLNGRTDPANGTPKIEVSDEYQFTGDESYLDKIYFDAILRDIDADGDFETVVVRSNSSMPSTDRTKLKFKIEARQTAIA